MSTINAELSMNPNLERARAEAARAFLRRRTAEVAFVNDLSPKKLGQPSMRKDEQIDLDAAIDAFLAAARADGWKLVRRMPDPPMVEAAQMKTEIGQYVCSNWAGAYDTIYELWGKMWDSAPEVKP